MKFNIVRIIVGSMLIMSIVLPFRQPASEDANLIGNVILFGFGALIIMLGVDKE